MSETIKGNKPWVARDAPGEKEGKEEEIKLQALIDNTAQGIFNYLKEIENKREIYKERWIWELLQNALDSAPEGGNIKIKIIKNDNKLIFNHNGRPFKPEEVAHLIYHGSTKKEQDVGKFGTGFLVTHLLSKEVNVKGIRRDGEELKKFEFKLDRNGTSSDDIKELMEKTWTEYQNSLEPLDNLPEYTAQFEYSLDETSLNTVVEGIDRLIKIVPYILVFNDKLSSIKISDETRELKFELIEETSESGCIIKRVKEESDGSSPIFHELCMVKDNDVEIAIKIRRKECNSYEIELGEDIPKIFIAFPLFGTHDLPFPVVVNSKKFEPTERRDGIFLGKGKTEDIIKNKELFEKATDLFIKLISDSNRWENVHALLSLQKPPNKDWLDQEWYTQLLRELIDKIRDIRIVKTESGCLHYTDAYFPAIDPLEEEKLEKLWELCYKFTVYKDRIPTKDVAFEWAGIIEGWKTLGLDLSDRQITIEKVAAEVESSGSLQNLKNKLSSDANELEILNEFYKLLIEGGKVALLDQKNILPDQNGNFKKKLYLFRDEKIDETLKNISSELGIDVRGQLLHLGISNDVQNLLNSKTQDEVLTQVINKVKQPFLSDRYLQANIELFNWLLENGKFEYLEGYPILSCKEKIFTQLSKKERVLAPTEIWDEKARMYADIFPQDLIFSSDYLKKISQKDKWDKLKDFILTEPIYYEAEKIGGEELALLSGEILEEDKEHETIDPVELSKIAFLEVRDKGIVDTIRKSKDKARKFLGFLFDYVVENDNHWSNSVEVKCKCGSQHKIYASSWLGTLKDRAWVPLRRDKSEKPNSQTLASIIKAEKSLLEKCKQDKPLLLLNRLNISISELMMEVAAEDENIRVELDKAMGALFSIFMTNPSRLNQIAQLAQSDPKLFIEEMEKRLYTREQIQRNQAIGSLVEKLLKDILEKEGFKVKVTGVGSDFVIENDFVKDNMETIFEVKKEDKICLYIEVKTTSQDFVKMTLNQAREAKDKMDRYALCVIQLNSLKISEEIDEEYIRKQAKFVMNIGEKIRDKVEKVENLKAQQEAISEAGDIEVEISEGPIRFKINKTVWEEGKTFEQFLEFTRGFKYE